MLATLLLLSVSIEASRPHPTAVQETRTLTRRAQGHLSEFLLRLDLGPGFETGLDPTQAAQHLSFIRDFMRSRACTVYAEAQWERGLYGPTYMGCLKRLAD